ncbi:unnamed protein product [Symbiodinium sp. KB8]|nr:unnamed protein product [Symbiodinium sp. KB8]
MAGPKWARAAAAAMAVARLHEARNRAAARSAADATDGLSASAGSAIEALLRFRDERAQRQAARRAGNSHGHSGGGGGGSGGRRNGRSSSASGSARGASGGEALTRRRSLSLASPELAASAAALVGDPALERLGRSQHVFDGATAALRDKVATRFIAARIAQWRRQRLEWVSVAKQVVLRAMVSAAAAQAVAAAASASTMAAAGVAALVGGDTAGGAAAGAGLRRSASHGSSAVWKVGSATSLLAPPAAKQRTLPVALVAIGGGGDPWEEDCGDITSPSRVHRGNASARSGGSWHAGDHPGSGIRAGIEHEDDELRSQRSLESSADGEDDDPATPAGASVLGSVAAGSDRAAAPLAADVASEARAVRKLFRDQSKWAVPPWSALLGSVTGMRFALLVARVATLNATVMRAGAAKAAAWAVRLAIAATLQQRARFLGEDTPTGQAGGAAKTAVSLAAAMARRRKATAGSGLRPGGRCQLAELLGAGRSADLSDRLRRRRRRQLLAAQASQAQGGSAAQLGSGSFVAGQAASPGVAASASSGGNGKLESASPAAAAASDRARVAAAVGAVRHVLIAAGWLPAEARGSAAAGSTFGPTAAATLGSSRGRSPPPAGSRRGLVASAAAPLESPESKAVAMTLRSSSGLAAVRAVLGPDCLSDALAALSQRVCTVTADGKHRALPSATVEVESVTDAGSLGRATSGVAHGRGGAGWKLGSAAGGGTGADRLDQWAGSAADAFRRQGCWTRAREAEHTAGSAARAVRAAVRVGGRAGEAGGSGGGKEAGKAPVARTESSALMRALSSAALRKAGSIRGPVRALPGVTLPSVRSVRGVDHSGAGTAARGGGPPSPTSSSDAGEREVARGFVEAADAGEALAASRDGTGSLGALLAAAAGGARQSHALDGGSDGDRSEADWSDAESVGTGSLVSSAGLDDWTSRAVARSAAVAATGAAPSSSTRQELSQPSESALRRARVGVGRPQQPAVTGQGGSMRRGPAGRRRSGAESAGDRGSFGRRHSAAAGGRRALPGPALTDTDRAAAAACTAHLGTLAACFEAHLEEALFDVCPVGLTLIGTEEGVTQLQRLVASHRGASLGEVLGRPRRG